ncbi:glycosyltransferase [Desulfopila sp. IMCC35008]|uniref:glycosyltransferase family 4 protein n=1 Tax=Desulfopila sp. IMCC35008 TaxID=2653858 RepID=UPI0013D4C6B1|nr:glycosyltransferase [Desulfopila sp. IMCC35008]
MSLSCYYRKIENVLPFIHGKLLEVSNGPLRYTELDSKSTTFVSEYYGVSLGDLSESNTNHEGWGKQFFHFPSNSIDCALLIDLLSLPYFSYEIVNDVLRIIKPGGFLYISEKLVNAKKGEIGSAIQFHKNTLTEVLEKIGFVGVDINEQVSSNSDKEPDRFQCFAYKKPATTIFDDAKDHEIEPISQNGKLCIIRANEGVYSETFIDDHIKYISNNTVVVCGFPLPLKILGSEFIAERDKIDKLENCTDLERNAVYADLLSQFFKSNNVTSVLAESTILGCAVFRACLKAEVPLIIHGLGLDVYAHSIVNNYRECFEEMFPLVHRVVAMSSHMKKAMMDMGAPEEKIVLNALGADTHQVKASPISSKKIFVGIGRFVEKKCPQATIQAFSMLLSIEPDSHLIFAGDGPLLGACKELSVTLGIQQSVTFCGVCTREQTKVLLRNARAFVQHSVIAKNGDQEGVPVAIIEAGAMAVPVISTYHSGIPDVVENGINGFLVNEFDVEGMFLAMRKLAENPELAQKMGERLNEKIQTGFSRKITIGRIQNIIREIDKQAKIPSFHDEINVPPLPYDRSDINFCVQLANNYINQGDLTKAIILLLEGSRYGDLPEAIESLISTLLQHEDIDKEALSSYFEKIGQNPTPIAQNRLKILVITNLLPPQEMGGFGRTVWEFIECLLKKGHEILALTSNMPQHQKFDFVNYQEVERHVERDLKLLGDWVDGKVVFEEDQKEINQIISGNHEKIMEAVKKFSPDTCMLGNLDLLGYNYIADIADRKIPMLHRLGNSTPSYPSSFKFDQNYYILAGCSSWLNDHIKKSGYDISNYTVLYPGSPIEYYYKYSDPPFDILRICFASLVMPYKGAQTLVEALGLLKFNSIPFTCEIAGDTTNPEFVSSLNDYAQQHGFGDQIEFKGFLSKEEMSQMFGRCNTLVFPSVFDEPFGKTQIEAMAAGICVVSSGTGGSREIVKDGENGLVFEKENAIDLANKLSTLHNNRGYWVSLAAQGKEDAFNFTTLKSVEKIEREFDKILNCNASVGIGEFP